MLTHAVSCWHVYIYSYQLFKVHGAFSMMFPCVRPPEYHAHAEKAGGGGERFKGISPVVLQLGKYLFQSHLFFLCSFHSYLRCRELLLKCFVWWDKGLWKLTAASTFAEQLETWHTTVFIPQVAYAISFPEATDTTKHSHLRNPLPSAVWGMLCCPALCGGCSEFSVSLPFRHYALEWKVRT
jgi:hypothetical protein